ncbi:hypothetical protein M413DRAFT_81702 [Hebeloma cylindrosporum]|uniref:Uncharacterized protein n=1 Tax=Hebeloma cylindrosporum TaxID=76867 RepID=A0A0C3CWR6_HEBCY|nr:hypothetical protein M413DRAFT_81702 [Hebeloma cylindrosporum h7]
MNLKKSMSDGSPGVPDHHGKSADIAGEKIHGDINQIQTSLSEDVEHPTVNSMKVFFEAIIKAKSTKESASKIAPGEEVGSLRLRGLARTVSTGERTFPKTPFLVHPRQPVATAPPSSPLPPSVSTSGGQGQRAKVIEEVVNLPRPSSYPCGPRSAGGGSSCSRQYSSSFFPWYYSG